MDDKITRQLKREDITKKIAKILHSIDVCKKSKLVESAFILFYSLVDILASLDRDVAHLRGERSDFIKWADTYLLQGNNFEFTALELYAARCGILHALSSDSDLSRSGSARRIFYAWGDKDVETLKTALQDEPEAVAVHLDDLFIALTKGVEKFWASCPLNSERERLILSRADETIVGINFWQMQAFIQAKKD